MRKKPTFLPARDDVDDEMGGATQPEQTERYPLKTKKKQLKLLEDQIWRARNGLLNEAQRSDAIAKLLKLFREIQADDLEEQLVFAFQEIERLKVVVERRPATGTRH